MGRILNYTGVSGWSGTSGYSGFGVSGYSGISGYSGFSGVSGWSGYSGTSGWSGYSGKSGYSGSNGTTGTSGYSGFSGTNGTNGTTGTSGYSGFSGTSGYSGPTSIPQNSQTTGYTLVIGDVGKHVSITGGGVTVPASIFSAGDVVTIFNNSATPQTITQGASVTMYLGGTATTGNRALAAYGICTVLCFASNSFVIAGAGLT